MLRKEDKEINSIEIGLFVNLGHRQLLRLKQRTRQNPETIYSKVNEYTSVGAHGHMDMTT